MSDQQILAPRLIRASAGTGKTRDLSSRYIGLLARGETPDKILATTFTRKAAAEIRERIFSRLAFAARSAEGAAELAESIALKSFKQYDARLILRRLVAQQHRLLITTLDALFISMARSFALELGLPINWRIGSEEDGKKLRELAIRGVLEDDDNNQSSALEIVRLIHGGDLSRSVHEEIVSEVQRLYRYFIATEIAAWSWISSIRADDAPAYEGLGDIIKRYQVPNNSSGGPNKNIQKLVVKLETIQATRDWKALSGMKSAKDALKGQYQYHSQTLAPELREVIDGLVAHARIDLTRRYSDRLSGIHAMLDLYHNRYGEAQRRLGILSFDDVKSKLASSSVLGQLEPLYYRLDSRICHLLLDEFQDTSMNEWRVLEPIADEILSRPGERSFFCVGDMKQAIYGWRGGVAEIFGSIESRWSSLKPESKQTTYRCAPAIIDFVNSLFSGLDKAPCLNDVREAVDSWLERFEPHGAARKTLPGQVVMHRLGEGASKAAFTVDLVVELQQRYPGASIGVLVRKNRAVSDLLARFSEAHPGMAVSEEGAIKITDSPLVRAIMSLLRFVDHPGDTLAAFHVERCQLAATLLIPFKDKSLAATWVTKIRERLLREGYGTVISEWARVLEIECGDLDRQRLRQLVDQAYLYDLERTTRVADFVSHIERVTVELPSEASIRVMSLHKAKGLEFDIVVLPELEDKIAVKSDEILVGQDTPISPVKKIALGTGTEFERLLIPELGTLWHSKLDAITVESLSLLYVGVTRPRQILHLVLPDEKSMGKVSSARVLNEIFDTDEADALLFGSKDIEVHPENQVVNQARAFSKRKINFGGNELATRAPRLDKIRPSRHNERPNLINPSVLGAGELARARGTALHLLFEQVGWLEDFSEGDINKEGIKRLLGAEHAEQVIGEFHKLLIAPEIVTALSRSRFGEGANLVLKREQAFAIRDGENLVSGVIDRLVIRYEGDKPVLAEVLDYKSDRLSGPGAINDKLALYKEQVDFYIKATKALLGADISVTGKLVFLDGGIVRGIGD
jgi:ATP-dependent exoDNAse (exonuclease V) beta subunit